MAPWQQAAVGAAVFIAVHYLFLRAASGKIPDTLGALVLEATAAAGILANYFFGPKGDAVATTTRGIAYAIVSGLCITGASILLFAALRKGGPVAATGTIVLGGGVALSAIAALLDCARAIDDEIAIDVAKRVETMWCFMRVPTFSIRTFTGLSGNRSGLWSCSKAALWGLFSKFRRV